MSTMNGAAIRPVALSGPRRPTLARLEHIMRTACRPVVRRLPGRVQVSLKRLSDTQRNRTLIEHLPLEERTYLRLNPDVAEAVRGGRCRSGLEHLVNFGIDELETSSHRVLRIPLHGYEFDFDPSAYCMDNPDAAMLIAQGRFRSATDHFLRVGYSQCREGTRSLYASNRFVRCLAVEGGEAAPAADRRYLALFAHYDRDGIIDEYVVRYLSALRDAGADICFITSTAAPNELEKIRQFVFRIIIKNNAGRDFGSWYLALESIQTSLRERYAYVLFINDSVYFPVVDCGRMFAQMAASKLDLWGITDSRQCGYHLQSYFLGFSHNAQKTLLPWFAETIRSTPYMTKYGQIASLELGLTQHALETGLAVGALCSIDTINNDVLTNPRLSQWRSFMQVGRCHINPSHALWDLLIARYGCPALKIELLRDNPLGLDTRRWVSLAASPSLNPIVQRHLDRMKKQPCAPTAEQALVEASIPATRFSRHQDA
ncbi:MAG: rhamnan synthesis F family protein [Xanthobacteraceae bacterium]